VLLWLVARVEELEGLAAACERHGIAIPAVGQERLEARRHGEPDPHWQEGTERLRRSKAKQEGAGVCGGVLKGVEGEALKTKQESARDQDLAMRLAHVDQHWMRHDDVLVRSGWRTVKRMWRRNGKDVAEMLSSCA